MAEIKTYFNVKRDDAQVHFGISRMEDIYVRHEGKPDLPHRHEYFTILLVLDAEGTHTIDFEQHKLQGNQAHFIAPGQVHQLVEARKSSGYSIVFSASFLAKNNIPLDFLDDVPLFQMEQSAPLILTEEQTIQLQRYCEEMLTWYGSAQLMNGQALGALLRLFIISSSNYCTIPPSTQDEIEAGTSIIKKFKQLLNLHVHEWHATSTYAEELAISPDHLNRTIKSLTGKTAKDSIQSRIVIAAKRLLYFTDHSTKEIAFQLGFEEPSHFSSFFKKCTGQSPTSFRKKQ